MCDNQIFIGNIEQQTKENDSYRKVIYTVDNSFQLVYHALYPEESIPFEKHEDITQFFRFEEGIGLASIKVNVKDTPCTYQLADGVGLIVPPNTWHKIENTSKDRILKFYTIYNNSEHPYDQEQYEQP